MPDVTRAYRRSFSGYLLVDSAAYLLVRRCCPQYGSCRVAVDYTELVRLIGDDRGCTVVVDPMLLPTYTTELADVIRRTDALLIFLTDHTPVAARAILQHAKLDPHSLLVLPFDSPERIARTLNDGVSHALQLMFLRAIAPRFTPAVDSLVPGVVAALHGGARLDSVKTLAAFCQASARSVERWFRRIGIMPKLFLASARFVRARTAFDWGWLPHDAARFSGYSRAQSMWRAVRNELGIEPRAFRGLAPRELTARSLILLEGRSRTPAASMILGVALYGLGVAV